MDTFVDDIRKSFNLGESDVRSYSPLVLAYIGDSVYEVIIRTLLADGVGGTVQKLHKKATKYVKASAQAFIITALFDELTEEEQDVCKRGRNAKSHKAPKNGSIGEYHRATAFEAVIGYLFLKNDNERILYIVKKGIEMIDANEAESL